MKVFEEDIVNAITSGISPDLDTYDCIFSCAPVSVNIENAGKIMPFLKKDAVLTDVSSIENGMHHRMHDCIDCDVCFDASQAHELTQEMGNIAGMVASAFYPGKIPKKPPVEPSPDKRVEDALVLVRYLIDTSKVLDETEKWKTSVVIERFRNEVCNE